MSMAEPFAQTGFPRFANSPVGRLVRIIVDLGLMAGAMLNGDSPLDFDKHHHS